VQNRKTIMKNDDENIHADKHADVLGLASGQALLVRVENENIINHNQSSRFTSELMWTYGYAITDALVVNKDEKRITKFTPPNYPSNIALGVGLLANVPNLYNNDSFREYGPTLNLQYIFHKIEMQCGGYVHYLRYSTDNQRMIRGTYGGFAQIGFSMLSAYFGLGKGYGIDAEHNLSKGLLFTTGVTITIPSSKLNPF
jgi:hypothetical protein